MSLPRLSAREKHLLIKAIACAVLTIEAKPAGTATCAFEMRQLLSKLTNGKGEADAYLATASDAVKQTDEARPDDLDPR